jgi:hypothetical protein
MVSSAEATLGSGECRAREREDCGVSFALICHFHRPRHEMFDTKANSRESLYRDPWDDGNRFYGAKLLKQRSKFVLVICKIQVANRDIFHRVPSFTDVLRATPEADPKAEDLVGVNGPRFALNDASSGYSYVLTDPVLGTIPWTEQTAEFTTGCDTTALIFRVLRSPTLMLIRSRILIDDVRLTPIT